MNIKVREELNVASFKQMLQTSIVLILLQITTIEPD